MNLSNDQFPVGLQMDVTYPEFSVSLTLDSAEQLTFEIKEGPFARTETVAIEVVSLGNGMFAVSWQEASGATVTNVQDFDRLRVHSIVTMPDGTFLRMTGPIAITREAALPSDDLPERNKALVLEAMTALFQKRDATAVERLYAPDYIQHNPGIPQGRAALASLVSTLGPDVYYEPGLIVAEGTFVAIHGRIRGWAPSPQVVVDIFRIHEGRLAEHWDVLQDEVDAPAGQAAMFDPDERSRQKVPVKS